ncbi:hypothetical protein V2I01_34020 [Micromonospora sp. BRA006-A]|nr:hypothetical protein [Micromonospora sp. BRA006-A]
MFVVGLAQLGVALAVRAIRTRARASKPRAAGGGNRLRCAAGGGRAAAALRELLGTSRSARSTCSPAPRSAYCPGWCCG